MTSTTKFDAAFLIQYSSPELRALVEAVTVELKKREAGDVAAARAKIHAIAQDLGVTVAELVGKPKAQQPKVAMRYRNPTDATQEWTGRGRQPKWVAGALAAGAALPSLEIPGYVAAAK